MTRPRGILFLMFCAGVALLAGSGAAQIPEPLTPAAKTGRAAMFSADRRFMVSGLTSAENMVLAGRLAELAQQVEASTGQVLPMRRDQVLGVMVQSASSPDSRVLKLQGWDEGRFYQRLVVPGLIRFDEEDLMEGAVWLLLNRYAAEYTPEAQRTGLGAGTPDWISSGLAQNTQTALRSRNRDWVARELADGRLLPLAQVIKQEVLPPGRWREKAYAAAAMEFLFPDGDVQIWTALFKAVGARQPVDAAWLRRNCPALRDQRPEEAWRAWLEARARTRTIEAWSDRGLLIEERLLQVLNFQPRDLASDIPAGIPGELFARDLIDYRGQPWVPPVAAALSLQVQSLKLGAPAPLQEVLASYAAFFDLFATPPPEKLPWWKKSPKEPRKIQPPDDATWQVALNQLWRRAEIRHQEFLERHQGRKRYVDSFEPPSAGETDRLSPDETGQPRTRAQKYMDDVEEQRKPGTH